MNKKLFGIDCLGCGTQRALVLVLRGEFLEAFKMFPAIFTTLLLLGFVALHFIDKSRNYQKVIIGLAIVNAVIMVAAYIYKMTNF